MDARIQKHRMIRWLGCLLVLLSLMTPLVSQAQVESVPHVYSWCGGFYGRGCYASNSIPTSYIYPTDSEAMQADFALRNILEPDTLFTLISCDGMGWCEVCVTTLIALPGGSPVGTKKCSSGLWTAKLPVCPAPKVNPSIPYRYNYGNGMCERPAQQNLTIALSGGSEIEPSNNLTSTVNTLPLIATVIDQNTNQPPTNPVKVKVSLKVAPTSGGHDHGTSDRPRGGIAELDTCPSDDTCWTSPNPTDSGGTVVFNFNAPEASGTYTISATCAECSNTATKPVDVKVDDLWPISASTYYALTEDGSSKIIGSTTEHSSNHYVSSEAQLQLWKLATDFYNDQVRNGVTNPTLLHLNDASLKWGGKFDIHGKWNGQHDEHRRGTVIDVRANSTSGAIPPTLFENYIDMATKLGIDPHLEYKGDPVRQHFHTRLLNREE